VAESAAGQPLLLLLHGLGATRGVWTGLQPILDERWPGTWLAPDLPGHGRAAPLLRYSFGSFASALATGLDPRSRIVVLGHSLGGVIGLALASRWFGVHVTAVVGLGIKVGWSAEERAKAQALATRPVGWFDSRQEAAARYLRVAGLDRLLGPDDAVVASGILEERGRWRLAVDPKAFGVGAPDMRGLLAAARARTVLVRGEHDPLVSLAQLRELEPSARDLPGLGHNAHVEDPAALWPLVEATLDA
jgi:pimeloyl-ACP methyl ester carboxylesterase